MSHKYLFIEEIIFFNKLQIETFSPAEPIGVADRNALEMIVEQPKATVFGGDVYKDISEKAGILFINLVKKHPFFNANKRTAAMALDVFLAMNGYHLELTNKMLADLTVEVAIFDGDFDQLKNNISSKIRNNLSSTESKE
ncbi:type II toxin-antitoxin system death-on-curing family toxin [Candidatus Enterococcus willemsii]|uniref:Fido domain-containing protein n=1 Tax=Candidatus Enterococcus willemsii TaxID=1857215 RepID=A0ABQ6YWC2_9ENTE|nr:type II toxin-antitoxin system death-on-curing family toxin [Enterococcus sp. CU12B]KAF1302001.1 hypothetical protein BAU17_01125 [Enterococcus sp. CU12B]